MKKLFFIVPLMISAAHLRAEVITLKDGTRLEGTVEGEMNGVRLIKTGYGSLNIDSGDILNIGAPPEIVVNEPFNASTAAVSVPTPGAQASVPAGLPPAPGAGPQYTFKTVALSTAAFEKIYFEDGVVIATETFDSKGELTALSGLIKDGSYREYYENGNLKTEKTVINARPQGTFKAYYPNGVLQSSAYYLQGKLSGGLRIYNENAKLLFEQNFKDGTPDGWFREFDEAGGLKSELFYADGRIAGKPKPAETGKAAVSGAVETVPESPVTAKSRRLARGEHIYFYLNGKYVARVQLDRDFNIISKDGGLPDGAVKVYGKNDNLEKEFSFLKSSPVSLKVYDANGTLAGEYSFREGKAVKK